METRVASLGIGVHRKRLKKQNRKKKKKSLLKKVVDFLKSDSYMFAPLVCSSQSSDFPSSNTLSTSPAGVDTRKPIEESPKKLLEKVGVYLTSDYYMYAPLVDPQPLHHLDSNSNAVNLGYTGQVWHLKRVTAEVSTRKMSKKIDQPTKRTENIVREDQPSGNSRLESSTVVQQTLAHQDKVKQMVQKKCHSSSVPGKGKLETARRTVVVE